MTVNYRWERIERLLKEIEYECCRGMMGGELDENIQFRFIVPVSKTYPTRGVVYCEFRTRPIENMAFGAEAVTREQLITYFESVDVGRFKQAAAMLQADAARIMEIKQQSRGNWIDAEQQAQRVRELEAEVATLRQENKKLLDWKVANLLDRLSPAETQVPTSGDANG